MFVIFAATGIGTFIGGQIIDAGASIPTFFKWMSALIALFGICIITIYHFIVKKHEEKFFVHGHPDEKILQKGLSHEKWAMAQLAGRSRF